MKYNALNETKGGKEKELKELVLVVTAKELKLIASIISNFSTDHPRHKAAKELSESFNNMPAW